MQLALLKTFPECYKKLHGNQPEIRIDRKQGERSCHL